MKIALKGLLPLVVLFAGLSTFAYLKSSRAVIVAKPPTERVWVVKTAPTNRATHHTSIIALGIVVAGRTAVLRPEVPGKLVELSPDFRDGAVLRKDAILLGIDPFDYETALADARAALTQAENRLEQLKEEQKGQRAQLAEATQSETLAATEVRRQQELVNRGVSTRRALDDATRTLNASAQNVASINSAIRSLESQLAQQTHAIERAQLTVQVAERDLINRRILAPFDGFLSNPNAALGQHVSVNDTLGQLVAADEMEVRFSISDSDFASLDGPAGALLEKDVTVTWSPGIKPISFPARISRQSAQTVAASGGIEMFARFITPGLSLPLRPGMFVSVTIAEKPLVDAVAVPISALVDGERLYAVQTKENSEKRLALVTFKLLRRRNGIAYLRTDLEPGTQVVTDTFPQIVTGLKVDPRPVKKSMAEQKTAASVSPVNVEPAKGKSANQTPPGELTP